MPDPRPDAPTAPSPDASLPWHAVGTVFAAAAVGIVTYVGFTGAQLFGMVSATPEPLVVAEPPLVTPYVAPPSEDPAEEPAPEAVQEDSEPSRSKVRKPKPKPTPSPTSSPEPKAEAEKSAAPRARTKADTVAAPATRQEKLEVKHATWADRQIAKMLRAMPTSPISWYTGDTWVNPTSSYHLTAEFGESGRHWSSTHTGLDFAAATGTPVRAVTAGTVTSVGWGGAYGNKIVVTHPDGSETWYCHLSRAYADVGAQVGTGAVIGAVGATGNVTGPHLHFEVRIGGSPVDPYQALVQHGVRP